MRSGTFIGWYRRKPVLTWVLAFTIIGVAALVFTRAASPASSFIEPENGTLAGAATVGNDMLASNGGYLRFGNGSSGGTTILFDDFTGTSIDRTKWDVYDRISDQVNQEVNCVIPANISLSGGILSGLSKHEDRSCGDSLQAPVLEHYTSWQIGQKVPSFQYGTVEVRAKEPGGTGIWPTIFLLGYLWQPTQAATANAPNNWPVGGWSEVDIAEFMHNYRTQVNNSLHFNVGEGEVQAPLAFNASSQFAIYRLQWSANAMVWSVDAEDGAGFRTTRTVTDPSKIPNVPMYLTINAAIGGAGGAPDPNTYPQTFQVDWVRITQ